MRSQFHPPFPNKSEPSGCLIMDTLRYAAENETLKRLVLKRPKWHAGDSNEICAYFKVI